MKPGPLRKLIALPIVGLGAIYGIKLGAEMAEVLLIPDAERQARAEAEADEGAVDFEIFRALARVQLSKPDLSLVNEDNPHCVKCGDLRGGQPGHETSECKWVGE